MFWFNSEEVYIGYSQEDLLKVRECLEIEHIKYGYRIMNHSGQSRGRSGTFGLNTNFERQYQVYVKRKDYERAQYLVDKALHRN